MTRPRVELDAADQFEFEVQPPGLGPPDRLRLVVGTGQAVVVLTVSLEQLSQAATTLLEQTARLIAEQRAKRIEAEASRLAEVGS